MYKILSFDGGGVYGVLSLCVLDKILEKRPNLIDSVNLLTGTSIGSLIAISIAAGRTPSELIGLFPALSKSIFSCEPTRLIKSYLGLCAKYDNANFESILEKYFGQVKLGELKKKILVPSFNLCKKNKDRRANWKAKFFHNLGGNDCDGNELAKDVVLRSTAAPLFFPSYQGYVDGFFVGNNPSLCAVVQTQDPRNEEPNPKITDVSVISIGTREFFSICEQRNDWGFVKWAAPFVNIMLTKDEGIANYQCDKLLGKRYKRIEVTVPDELHVGMDDYKSVPKFIEFGKSINLDENIFLWLDQNWH